MMSMHLAGYGQEPSLELSLRPGFQCETKW